MIFVLRDDAVNARCVEHIRGLPLEPLMQVRIDPHKENRSLEQNSHLHAAITDVAKQVCWHGKWLSVDDWKVIFSAALHKQAAVPNLDGSGFVVLGKPTSKMKVGEMSDLIDLIYAFGNEKGVKFKEPA